MNEWLVAVSANFTAALLAGLTLGAFTVFLVSIFRWRVREHEEETRAWVNGLESKVYKSLRFVLLLCAVTALLLLLLGPQARRVREPNAPGWTWVVFVFLLVLVVIFLLLAVRAIWFATMMSVGNAGYFIAMVQEGRRFDDPPASSPEDVPALADVASAPRRGRAICAAATFIVGLAVGGAWTRRKRR